MINDAPAATATSSQSNCEELNKAPDVPQIQDRGTCPKQCDCPTSPGGEPPSCLDDLIGEQNIAVKKAERAKAFADELIDIQNKIKSAQVDYTQARFNDLLKIWKEQDTVIVELIRKLVCAVPCWKCLLECRLCKQLREIRTLEDRLNGPPGKDVKSLGPLTEQVYSLLDQQAWHQRNVVQMEARLKRIKDVLAAWEKPSATLGETLEKNDKLIKETLNIIASDSAKAVYDVFMTLIPRHWAIRPRDPAYQSDIDEQYVRICECPKAPEPKLQGNGTCDPEENPEPGKEKCECDEGMPDDCCGPDVGILSLRQRLIGPLPYIVNPKSFSDIICCITSKRLSPASDQFAAAQANLAESTAKIELVTKQIVDKKAEIEAKFRAELPNPIECSKYATKYSPATPDSGSHGDKNPTVQSAH